MASRARSVLLFAYDFPHKKTIDFITTLHANGYAITAVLAAPWRKLPIPKKPVRTNPRHVELLHPKLLCRALSIPYIPTPHEADRAQEVLASADYDFAVIAGARILPQTILAASKRPIINTHPGLLPEVRGLDSILWAIHYDMPIGITAHFLGKRIDSGIKILRKRLPMYQDDSIIDLSLRLLEYQPPILIEALSILERDDPSSFPSLSSQATPYNTSMPINMVRKQLRAYKQWLQKHASDK